MPVIAITCFPLSSIYRCTHTNTGIHLQVHTHTQILVPHSSTGVHTYILVPLSIVSLFSSPDPKGHASLCNQVVSASLNFHILIFSKTNQAKLSLTVVVPYKNYIWKPCPTSKYHFMTHQDDHFAKYCIKIR